MKKLKGTLKFKKVSQGVARFEADVDGVIGNFTLQLDSSVLGTYDPIYQDVTGKIILEINVKKKK